MTLPLREMLTLLMPPSVFYRRRIAHEVCSGEPELGVLSTLVPRGGTAKSAHHAVSGGRGVTFVLVDLRDRHRNLRRREEEI